MKQGYTENVSFIDEVSPEGVVTNFSFEGDQFIVKKTYDAEPHLEYARQLREAQDGQRWGEGKIVAHIPPVECARIMALPTKAERQAALHKFLRESPAFVAYSRYLKDLKR